MADETVIKVEHVSKTFVLPHEKSNSLKSAFTGIYRKRQKSDTTQQALQDISFEIKKGEFFGIVGRNGSGKSTMLKILANIYQPTEGSVTTHGKLVPFIELGVGFNPELTGRENVYLNGAMLGFARNEIDCMYEDIVRFAELERFMDQKLKNYSSGMQVRLAFSMATRSEADILLIDEVLAVGDADFQRKCFNYFRQLKRNKKTVVFVSHDMDAVQEYCDRAILIEESKIVSAGKTPTVTDKYRRLFNSDKQTAADDSSNAPARWGKGGITTAILDVKTTATQITIEHTVRAEQAFDSPIIGIRIRSSDGQNITGTNTKIEKIAVGKLSQGARTKVTWAFPNVLSEGTYLVDPAILSSDGITVQDWWDDATTFTVTKNRHIPYIIDPIFSVTIDSAAGTHG